jgi:hypothetical protein
MGALGEDQITARALVSGMVIIDRTEKGKREIAVTRVVVSPEGCRHSVHVNNSLCYGKSADVTVAAP